MAKRLQSGDIHNHIDRRKCRDSAQQLKRLLFFVAQGGPTYRKWPNGCRVATSTTTLTATNAAILPPSLHFWNLLATFQPEYRHFLASFRWVFSRLALSNCNFTRSLWRFCHILFDFPLRIWRFDLLELQNYEENFADRSKILIALRGNFEGYPKCVCNFTRHFWRLGEV